jgi:large subunit ribosomal protein L5
MAETAYVPRLRTEYDRKIRSLLTEKFGYENAMQVPRLDKVVLNMGVGDSVNDRKKAETAAAELTQIAGQKAIVTYSRIARTSRLAARSRYERPACTSSSIAW